MQEYARGIAGGLLFSLPILYTMEVWWAGFIMRPLHLVLYMLATFLLLLGYNRFAGVHEGTSWKEVIVESVEEIGLGMLLSCAALWILGRINFSTMAPSEIVGKVIIESMTVAIGVSIGTAQLGAEEEEGQENRKTDKEIPDTTTAWGVFQQATLSLCGAVVIAGNIAPTEEIQLISYGTSPIKQLIIVLFSLFLGVLILFLSNFRGGRKPDSKGLWFTVIVEVGLAYLAAVSASAFMLWFFGHVDGIGWNMFLAQVIVLGLPAMLGASAGRLLIR